MFGWGWEYNSFDLISNNELFCLKNSGDKYNNYTRNRSRASSLLTIATTTQYNNRACLPFLTSRHHTAKILLNCEYRNREYVRFRLYLPI